MNEYFIAPSILAADFARLGKEVDEVIEAGADIIHFDVMDNHYVPNLTVGPMVCRALIKYGIKKPIDVHLMVEPVDNLIIDFAKAGAKYISFHPEASKHIDRSINLIKSFGINAGLVFNPATPLSYLEHTLAQIDLVLIMSVNPGFGGQKFIKSSLEKITQVRQMIDEKGLNTRLEIDGGINLDNIKNIAKAGADTFVAGSAIFGTDDYASTISKMRSEIAQLR